MRMILDRRSSSLLPFKIICLIVTFSPLKSVYQLKFIFDDGSSMMVGSEMYT